MTSVLERNVAALLARAYVPVAPRARFRRALQRRVRAEARALAAERRPAPARRLVGGRRAPRLEVALAAAAALLLALWAAGRLLPDGGRAALEDEATLAGLVARGDAAVRAAEGEWRALDARELAHGLDASALALPLELATPAARGLEARRGSAVLALAPSSRARLAEAGAAPRAAALRVEVLRGAASVTAGEGPPVRLGAGESLELPAAAAAPLAAAPDDGAPFAPAERGPGRTLVEAPAARPDEGAHAPDDAPPAAPGATLLEGRVLGPDGAPLPRFRLLAVRLADQNADYEPRVREVDAADGRFAWPDLSPGKWRVRADAPGLAVARGEAVELAPGATATIELRLSAGGALAGAVADEATGNPVAGAWVVSETDTPARGLPLRPDADGGAPPAWLGAAARTDARGRFRLAPLSPGEHVLRVTAPGHAPARARATVREGGETTLDTVLLGVGGAVAGRVVGADGAPVAGAFLLVFALPERDAELESFAWALADERGVYEIRDLAPGPHMVLKWDAPPDEDAGAPALRPAVVRSGATVRADFLEFRGVRVTGRFLDAAGEPAPHLRFSIVPRAKAGDFESWLAGATDEDGAYATVLPGPGPYLVYSTLGMGEKLVLCAELDVPDASQAGLDVRLPAAAAVARAVRGDDGRPLGGAVLVVVREEPDGARTFAAKAQAGADGRIELEGLLPGTYAFEAWDAAGELGAAAAEGVVVPAAPGAAPVEIELVLHPGGSLVVRVVDETGAPVDGALVTLRRLDAGREIDFAADRRTRGGAIRANGLPPGAYALEASAEGHAAGRATARVAAHAETEATVVLRRASAPPSSEESGEDR